MSESDIPSDEEILAIARKAELPVRSIADHLGREAAVMGEIMEYMDGSERAEPQARLDARLAAVAAMQGLPVGMTQEELVGLSAGIREKLLATIEEKTDATPVTKLAGAAVAEAVRGFALPREISKPLKERLTGLLAVELTQKMRDAAETETGK